MNLPDVYRKQRCPLSFELFPPKTPAGFKALLDHVQKLDEFEPAYYTCTYGAGGSTQTATLDVIQEVKSLTGKPVASHLTCVGANEDQLRSYLQEAIQRGTDYIVALRGDPPKGTTEFVPVEGGFRYANELVSLISGEYAQLGIAVAGYPEVHQEAPSAEIDLQNLKRKVDAGADCIITQLFYDNEDFYQFRDRCRAAGIDQPIIPGILPITNYAQAKRIAGLCKASLPESLESKFAASDSDEEQFQIGIEHARHQVNDLVESGVDGLHLYVLNKSRAARELLSGLQLGTAGVA